MYGVLNHRYLYWVNLIQVCMSIQSVNYKCLYKHPYLISFSQSYSLLYNDRHQQGCVTGWWLVEIFVTLEAAMSAFRISIGYGTVMMKNYKKTTCTCVHDRIRNHNPTNRGLLLLPASDHVCNIYRLLIKVNGRAPCVFIFNSPH